MKERMSVLAKPFVALWRPIGAVGKRVAANKYVAHVGRIYRVGKKRFSAWRLKRRRARAAGKKSSNRRMAYLLASSLILLLGVFFLSLRYLDPSPTGERLTVNQFATLADQGRLVNATFLDEEAIISGSFTEKAPPAEDKKGKSDATGKDPDVQSKDSAQEPEDTAGKTEGDTADPAAQADTADPAAEGATAGKPEGDASDPEAGGDAAGKTEGDDGKGANDPVAEDSTQPEPEGIPHVPVPEEAGRYWIAYPQSDAVTGDLIDVAVAAEADVLVDSQSVKGGIKIVTTFLLPLMILANLFALLFSAGKGGGSGIGEVMTFGTIGKKGQKGKKGKSAKGAVTFEEVAGADEAVTELREVVDYLADPAKYEDIGAIPPKGVLLVGPPGCGKTLIAKAVAGEAGVPFFSVAGAEFVESLVGVGAARVRDLFARVRAVAPAIVFIDELDAAGRKRGSGGGDGGSDEREQTLNQMLVEMDGFEASSGLVVMGATNRPDILDPALLRPGRFDRHVTVDLPDLNGREAILELHAIGKPCSPMVDFNYIARRTPGFSGADLANVVNESALLALRDGKIEIENNDLEEAIQRVLSGPKKRGQILSPEERKRIAYHEGGHAVVAAAAGRFEDIHRVSILSRGKGLGNTTIQSNTEAVLQTKSQLIAQLVTAMGGMAAEMIMFGEPSTGAEQDLEQATDLAQDMVGRFGMGSRRRRLLTKEGDSFLGDDLLVAQISSQTHQEMEHEIDVLIQDAEREAKRLLEHHKGILDLLAANLEADETLEGPELETILAQVRPEVTFFGGPGEGPIRHNEASSKGPMEQV